MFEAGDGRVCASFTVIPDGAGLHVDCERGRETDRFGPDLIVPDPDGPLWPSTRVFVFRVGPEVSHLEGELSDGERFALAMTDDSARPGEPLAAFAVAPDAADDTPVRVIAVDPDGLEVDVYIVPGLVQLHPESMSLTDIGTEYANVAMRPVLAGEFGGVAWTLFADSVGQCVVLIDVDRRDGYSLSCGPFDSGMLLGAPVGDQEPPPHNDLEVQSDVVLIVPTRPCVESLGITASNGVALGNSRRVTATNGLNYEVIELVAAEGGQTRSAVLNAHGPSGGPVREVEFDLSQVHQPWEPC